MFITLILKSLVVMIDFVIVEMNDVSSGVIHIVCVAEGRSCPRACRDSSFFVHITSDGVKNANQTVSVETSYNNLTVSVRPYPTVFLDILIELMISVSAFNTDKGVNEFLLVLY